MNVKRLNCLILRLSWPAKHHRWKRILVHAKLIQGYSSKKDSCTQSQARHPKTRFGDRRALDFRTFDIVLILYKKNCVIQNLGVGGKVRVLGCPEYSEMTVVIN